MKKDERENLARQMNTLAHGRLKFKAVCIQCDSIRTHHGDKSMLVDMREKHVHCFHCGMDLCWKGPEDYAGMPLNGRLPASEAPVYVRPKYIASENQTGLSEEVARYWVEKRCIPLDVLKTYDVGECMEWMPQTQQKERCICFHYFEHGQLINTKFRDGAKHFKLIKDAELIPWNIDSIEGSTTAAITEGEIDALSLIVAGYKQVVSVPNGAGGRNLTWLDRFVESHFESKTQIILALDTDACGIELRNELVRRLGIDKCRIVKWGPDCKDANEHLVRYGVESLRIAIEQAQELPLEGVFTAADMRDELLDIYENGMPEGVDTGLKNLDNVTRFEVNRTLVVTGTPGSGKSEFVDELMVRFMIRHDWRVAYFSPENRPISYHLRKIIMKLIGKAYKKQVANRQEVEQAIQFLSQNVYSVLPRQDYSVDGVLELIASLVRRRGIKAAVLDPFNRFDHDIPKGETETQYISRVFDTLNNFAMRWHILLVVVAHPTKMRRDPSTGRLPVPTLYDIAGSAAFFNKSDFGMVVVRNRDTKQTIIRVDKVRWNHLGDTGEAYFRYNAFNGRFTPMSEEEKPGAPSHTELEWDDHNWLSEKLAPKQGEIFPTTDVG